MSEIEAWSDDEDWGGSKIGGTIRPGSLLFPVLGFLAFELTLNPVFGVLVACLKPALEDGRTALWLLRCDPRKSRGWTCCFMFLAAGFWKTFAWSFVLGIALAGVSESLGGGAVLGDSLAGTMIASLFGFAILIFSSALAVGSSLLSGTRVWVSRDVHRARRAGAWPPSAFVRHEANNQADALMMPMLLVLCIGLVAMSIVAAMAVARTKLAAEAEGVIAVAVIGSMIVGSALILALRDAITRRMVAGTASACWPADEGNAEADEDEFGMPRYFAGTKP